MMTAKNLLIEDLNNFKDFATGWDGEHGQSVAIGAIEDAIQFVNFFTSDIYWHWLEAGMHPDGSVVVEIEDGVYGTFRFLGDGLVIATADGIEPQTVVLEGNQEFVCDLMARCKSLHAISHP